MRALFSKAALAFGLSLLIASLAFWSTYSLPGDLALQVASSRFIGTPPDTELAEGLRSAYGLDRPLLTQYGDWLSHVLRLDFGTSLATGRPVVEDMASYLRHTATLGALGLLAAIGLALPLGFLAGRRPGGPIDRLTSIYCGLFAALPSFLLGVLLIQVFVVEMGLARLTGDTSIRRLALPVAVAALTISAPLLRVSRNAVAEIHGASFYLFAQMRGVPARLMFLRHGMRNASLPVVAYLSTLFVYLVYDLVVIEVVFNYPGIGQALHHAIEARDVPVIQYATLVLVLAYLLLTAATDLLSQALDPRLARSGQQ